LVRQKPKVRPQRQAVGRGNGHARKIAIENGQRVVAYVGHRFAESGKNPNPKMPDKNGVIEVAAPEHHKSREEQLAAWRAAAESQDNGGGKENSEED